MYNEDSKKKLPIIIKNSSMPPQESFQNSNPSGPMTRLEPPIVNPLSSGSMTGQPAVSSQPTTYIKTAVPPSPQAPFSPPPTSSAKGAIFWFLVGSIVTVIFIGAGFYLYGMFLSENTPVITPEALQPAVRECGSDAPCLANAILLCAPAHGTAGIDDPLSFVVAHSVMDIVVNGAKSDASCGVIITQNSSSAALPDSFFEAAKIPEVERGAVNEQFAKDNAEPNALLDALTGQDAFCSLSSAGANALGTFVTRSREIEYSTLADTAVGTATPIIVAKIDGISVDIDFWRECSGVLAESRPKAFQDAALLVKVK